MNDASKMEVVKAFNNELVSLYDIKPPISKAKMTAITKAAMKSVKFYKHVVHGVEKFILKCRPDYKIPGLYVIDSIVRQSRHQFGVERDVFAPRFSKNLLQTFKNICQCPEEDKQKLVRVINLWQKHKVFPEDLLKKFLVMVEAAEEELPELYKDEIEAIQKSSKKSPTSAKKKKKSPIKSGFENMGGSTPSQNAFHSASRSLNFNDNSKTVEPQFLQQLQTLTSLLQQTNVPAVGASPATNGTPSDQVKFDKRLLDYDYGEEEEEPSVVSTNAPGAPTDSITSILTNPDILRQLHTLQVQLNMAQAQAKQPNDQPPIMDQPRMIPPHQIPVFNPSVMPPQPIFSIDHNMGFYHPVQNQTVEPALSTIDEDDKPEIIMEKHGSDPLEVIDLDHIPTPPSERSPRRSYSRSRSRSRSRTPSRSRRRRRSRSRSWNRNRSRDRENDERRRRALPPIKRKHLAVCSTTLWVGHLSKLVQETDLSDTFGEYGDIVSIDLIPPRGCAFIQMNRRQDADRALHKLKNTKIQGKVITLAWAPGKGMKGREWKDYWEVDYGVSYIPWSKLSRDTDFDLLEEGGMLDQETMPDWLKIYLEDKRKISYTKVPSSSKVLYTPSGTDMDESDNDGDDVMMPSYVNADMVLDSSNGPTDQMIPLPDGPQPGSEIHSLGIPLPPPGQNPAVSQAGPLNLPPPPPNLLNPFLPPRLLAPMGVLGGNFMPPPLGVPPPVSGLLMPPQSMLNRLPPPFPGPPGLPMINPGSGPNSTLSQIPLPDGSVNTSSSNDLKGPPFGLTPPLLFPGNPNLKLDVPGPIPPPLGNGEPGDSLNPENNPNLMIPNAFSNMIPPFAKNLNADQDGRLEDTDFRILGDLNSVNPMMSGMGLTEPMVGAGGGGDADQHKGGDNSGPADEPNFGGRGGSSNEYDRDRYRFNERSGGRNFDRDRDRDRDRDKYHHERNHRFGGGNRSPPYRENIFERGGSGDGFRRGGSRYDSRDFGRGGRDFRGDSAGPRGRGGRDGPSGRPRERSRDRDYYRSGRDYDDQKSSRRFERRGRSRERTPEERYGGKKSRWTAETSGGSNSSSAQDSWASVPVPPAPMMAASPPAMPAPPPAPVLTGDKSNASSSIAPVAFEETWDDSPPRPEPSPQRRNPSPPPSIAEPAQSPRASPQQSAESHPIQTIQTLVASREEAQERLWNEPTSDDYCQFADKQRSPTGECIEVMAGEPPPAPEMRPQPMQQRFETHPEFSALQSLAQEADQRSVGERSEYGDDPMDVVDQHEEQETDSQPMVADEAPAVADQYSTGSPIGDGPVLGEIPAADEAPSTFEQPIEQPSGNGGEAGNSLIDDGTTFDILPLPKAQTDDSADVSTPENGAKSGDDASAGDDDAADNAENGEMAAATTAPFHTGSPLFAGFRFRSRAPPLGRGGGAGGPPPLMGQGPPFAGMSFQRPRFQGHRPHMAFFQGPHPRQFSPFNDSRPPRPFSSRSNNY